MLPSPRKVFISFALPMQMDALLLFALPRPDLPFSLSLPSRALGSECLSSEPSTSHVLVRASLAPSLPTYSSLSAQPLPDSLSLHSRRLTHTLTRLLIPQPHAMIITNLMMPILNSQLPATVVCCCCSLPSLPCPQQFCAQQFVYPIAFLPFLIPLVSFSSCT